FFPKCQRNGCDFACQGEACHGGLDALGERGLIKLLQWSGPRTRSSGNSFEQTLQIMVMVFIETANRKQFLGAPQLAFHIAVFRADACLSPRIRKRGFWSRAGLRVNPQHHRRSAAEALW